MRLVNEHESGNGTAIFTRDGDCARAFCNDVKLFLLTGVYCGRMSDALGAMNMFTFAALVACASSGMMRIQWRRVFLILAGAVVVFIVAIVGVRGYLAYVSEGAYDKDELIASMQLMEDVVPSTIVKPAPNPTPLTAGQLRLQRIKSRGVIRVGYDPDRLPFSYINIAGKLVGFDIAMAQRLAQELGVSIEFGYESAPDGLNVRVPNCPKNVILYRLKAEVDELQSFVGKKANKQWLWLAIDGQTRQA